MISECFHCHYSVISFERDVLGTPVFSQLHYCGASTNIDSQQILKLKSTLLLRKKRRKSTNKSWLNFSKDYACWAMLLCPALSCPTPVLFILSFCLFVCVRGDNLKRCNDSNHELKVNTSYLQCIILRFYENDFVKQSNIGIISSQFISLEKENKSVAVLSKPMYRAKETMGSMSE